MSGESTATVFAARRTSFGETAATYDAVRPEWPAETISWLLGSPLPERVLRVVDLGCGTGKGSRASCAGRLCRGGDGMVQIPMRTWCYRLRGAERADQASSTRSRAMSRIGEEWVSAPTLRKSTPVCA
jgi:hypothetical protein